MSALSTRARKGLAVPAAVLSLALVTSACAGDEDSGPQEPVSAEVTELLGPENPAEGEPVTIGWVTQGQTQGNETDNEILAAQAVVEYANERLGGLGGRPIELVICEEKGTPAGSQACGNQFVQEGVAAAVGAALGYTDPFLQIATPEGIPVALNQGSTQAALTTPGVFLFSNGLATFGSPAVYARENDIDSAVMVVIDVPAASGPARQLGPTFFDNVGSSLEVVTVAPGTADMTPQIQAAEDDEPGLYHIMGNVAFCTTAIQAIRTLGIDADIVALDDCIGPDAAAIPGGYEGITVASKSFTDPDDEEFQLFEAIIDRYVDDEDFVAHRGYGGFQGMLSFVRAVNASEAPELTPAGITRALEEMPPTPYPLGGGATFQCNGEAMPDLAPNQCLSASFIATAEADGSLTDFQVIEAGDVYSMTAG